MEMFFQLDAPSVRYQKFMMKQDHDFLEMMCGKMQKNTMIEVMWGKRMQHWVFNMLLDGMTLHKN